MNPETGTTILTILKKRVPFLPTAIVCVDGEALVVRSLDGEGRDLGDDFDHFSINFSAPVGNADHQILYTSDVAQIIDPTDDSVIFDAEASDKRLQQ